MFLWVKPPVDPLCREVVESDATSTLGSILPADLDQLYEDTLNFIVKAGDDAHEIYSTTHYKLPSARPTKALLLFSFNLPLCCSALHIAASKGYARIVKVLIDEDADINKQTGFYGNSLQAAAYHGHKQVVELLLDAVAFMRTTCYSLDAFHAAAEGGHEDVIAMMLKPGYTSLYPT